MAKYKSLEEAVPAELVKQVAKAKGSQILGWEYPYPRKMGREKYEAQKADLQIEILKMQNWVKESGEVKQRDVRIRSTQPDGVEIEHGITVNDEVLIAQRKYTVRVD